MLWHTMLTSVWQTPLFMLGGLKCYTSTHTCPFVCSQHVVTGHWDWIVFDLHAQNYLNWLRSSDSNMVTKFLSSLVQVMACHKVGASHCLNQWWYIVNWNLRNKLMWNYIAKQIVCVLKICWKMLSAKQWPFCSGLDVLTQNKISHLLSF